MMAHAGRNIAQGLLNIGKGEKDGGGGEEEVTAMTSHQGFWGER